MTTLFFAKSRTAMTANVVKRADRRSLILRDDQAFAIYFGEEIIARVWELGLMTDQHPVRRENLLQLSREKLLRDKILLRQRLGPGLKSRTRFEKCLS